MLPFNAPNNSQGFTLIETMIIVVIIGILSAIAGPSFLGMLNRGKVNSALSEIQGALQQAQREAMRKSISCEVKLETTTNTITSNPTNCLVTGNLTFNPNNIVIATNETSFKFSYRGTITLSDAGTIVLSSKDNPSVKKCLVISHPLGIIRTGNYKDSTNSVTATKCEVK